MFIDFLCVFEYNIYMDIILKKGSGIMKNLKQFAMVITVLLLVFSFVACSPIDKNYGEASEVGSASENSQLKTVFESDDPPIMSFDRVMSKYFDISLFDEENYADIYLGKRFDIEAEYAGEKLPVPIKISEAKKIGWKLAKGNTYDENSLVFSYETVDAVIQNKDGLKLNVQFYNSSRSSVKLSDCYIVKFRIENDFYSNPKSYNRFDINGINNQMAITDIIYTLGTPSHFYKVSDKCYYLDYFITKKDRRNGITIYINPQDDSITSIEFSYYK